MRHVLLTAVAILLVYCAIQVAFPWRFKKMSTINRVLLATNETCIQNFCTFTILIPTIARAGKFDYLSKTLAQLEHARTVSFNPCIRVFHMRHGDTAAVQQLLQITNMYKHVVVHGIDKLPSVNNRFAHALLKPNEAQQTDDVYDMLTRAYEYACPKQEHLFMLMEDDFELCNGAEYQLLHVLDLASKRMDQYKQDAFSAIRVSTGLNGLLFPCSDIPTTLAYMLDNTKTKLPVDWLLENWWARNNLQGTSFHFYAHANLSRMAHRGPLLVYKYQLFEHIGVKSTMQHIWIAPHSKCNEPLIYTEIGKDYDLQACGHDLLSPCSASTTTSETTDAFHLPALTMEHSLAQVQAMSAEHCTTSCTECCAKLDKVCNPDYLPYINQCENSKYACGLESIACSTAPLISHGTLYLLSRNSRFFCHTYPPQGEVRICPCK